MIQLQGQVRIDLHPSKAFANFLLRPKDIKIFVYQVANKCKGKRLEALKNITKA